MGRASDIAASSQDLAKYNGALDTGVPQGFLRFMRSYRMCVLNRKNLSYWWIE